MSLRDIVIFLAGIEFFHTIDHIFIALFIQLPLNIRFMELTSTVNTWSIVINGVITILLLIWAAKLKK